MFTPSIFWLDCQFSSKIVRIVTRTACAIIAMLLACAQSSQISIASDLTENDVLGYWRLPENGSILQSYRCGNYVCVKIVTVADPSRRDANNPDPALRDRPLAGIVIADRFTKVDRGNARDSGSTTLKWRGRLYNTLDGVTYAGTMNLLNKDTITLVGCVLEGLFCEAKTIYRVKDGSQRNTAARVTNSTERAPFAPPPLPGRKPPELRFGSLADVFNSFLDAETARTSRIYSAEQRDQLFRGFLSWLDRQEAEDRNRITQQLAQ